MAENHDIESGQVQDKGNAKNVEAVDNAKNVEAVANANNVETAEAVDTPWFCALCCIPNVIFSYLVFLNDTLDTTTDIIFAVQLFREGKIWWGFIMSLASAFGMFNWISSFNVDKWCNDEMRISAHLNRKKGELMKKGFKSSSLKELCREVVHSSDRRGNDRPIIQSIIEKTRVNYMGQYLCCYKLGEDIPASIIRLFYAYEKQAAICSNGKFWCILGLVGTTTNMFGLLLSVLIFFWFAVVFFKTSWIFLFKTHNRIVHTFGIFMFISGFFNIAIGSLLGATAFYLAHAGFYAPSFIISQEMRKISYGFMGVIVLTSSISIKSHLSSPKK